MFIWTFIVEYGGGDTLVSQVPAENVTSAINMFNNDVVAQQLGLALPDKLLAAEWSEADSPVAVAGTKNVWCTDNIGKDGELVLAHIIKTLAE